MATVPHQFRISEPSVHQPSTDLETVEPENKGEEKSYTKHELAALEVHYFKFTMNKGKKRDKTGPLYNLIGFSSHLSPEERNCLWRYKNIRMQEIMHGAVKEIAKEEIKMSKEDVSAFLLCDDSGKSLPYRLMCVGDQEAVDALKQYQKMIMKLDLSSEDKAAMAEKLFDDSHQLFFRTETADYKNALKLHPEAAALFNAIHVYLAGK